jgi:nucleoside-diphosphate-sugar epimerase
LLCFGLGYSAEVVSRRLLAEGWRVLGTSRDPARRERLEALGIRMFAFGRGAPLPASCWEGITHVLSSVAPDEAGDAVLDLHEGDLRRLASNAWIGYLSSTSVYGDHDGAWVDESSPLLATSVRGRRRIEAEQGWLALDRKAHVFRLAGIYGPGRNVLERVRSGRARRVVKPGQFFSRIHVEDIAGVLRASMHQPDPGAVFNVADDEPAPATDVLAYAARLLDCPLPPEVPFEDAGLSEMARQFYADNRRVGNTRIREALGVTLVYPTYREGLGALL